MTKRENITQAELDAARAVLARVAMVRLCQAAGIAAGVALLFLRGAGDALIAWGAAFLFGRTIPTDAETIAEARQALADHDAQGGAPP